MRFLLRLPSVLAVLFVASTSLFSAGKQAEYLKAGDVMPSGMLRTDTGKSVELTDLVAGKPTVLIFYRGGWCPYCTRHLDALVEIVPALSEAGFQILAISPDRPEKLREKPDFGKLPYTLLSDSSMDTCRSFGLAFKVDDALVAKYRESYGIDLEGDSGETHHLLPHPAIFIVDSNGVIRFAHVDPNYKKRLDPEVILENALGVLEASL